jgi:DNA-binding beta-propeller fold protein YncE
MPRLRLAFLLAFALGMASFFTLARQTPTSGPYKILRTAKVGGDGGFDYVYADPSGRRLYVPRNGPTGRIAVFDLDTLAPIGEIPNASGHGVAIDSKTHHGFLTSDPIVMFDTNTLAKIKTIEVQGSPDGIFFDPYNEHLYDLSHRAPNVTVIDTKDGSIVGTIDLGGAPEQAVSDGKGHVYIDVEDKGNVAVVDADNLSVTAHYDVSEKGGTCAGLAMDAKNHILFSACRNPQNIVILNADDGKIITALPIGNGTDGAVFNPNTMEAFSSHADGTLTVIKENGPTNFVVEQNVQTMVSAKTMSLDSKTNKIFLIAAEYGPPPATPPAGGFPGRPNRGPMIPDSFSILVVGK